MTHFKWLKKEVPRWVKEEIITREAGDSLISLYRNEERHSHGEGLFVLAALGGLTPFIMLVAASLAVFETTGVSSAIFVSIFAAFLAVAVIGRGYRSDSNLLKWVGGCLLAAAGAVRVLDAALSFGQRGIFFLVIGAAAIIVCCLTFLPHAVKKIRRKPGRKTVRRDRQPAAPADQSAFLSDLPKRKTEEGGERRE